MCLTSSGKPRRPKAQPETPTVPPGYVSLRDFDAAFIEKKVDNVLGVW